MMEAGHNAAEETQHWYDRGTQNLCRFTFELLQRPPSRLWPSSTGQKAAGPRNERRLPLLGLTGPGATHVVSSISRLMNCSRERAFPLAHFDADCSDNDVRKLLDSATQQLSGPQLGSQRLKFPQYSLVASLYDLDLSTVSPPARALAIRNVLLTQAHGVKTASNVDAIEPLTPALFRAMTRTLAAAWQVLPRSYTRYCVSGRGHTRPYAWLSSQQTFKVTSPMSFLHVAERLTLPARMREDAVAIERLMVHAFLEDLRCAYRRDILHACGHDQTVYPTLLFENMPAESAARRLVERIAELRCSGSGWDPLLVIAAVPDSLMETCRASLNPAPVTMVRDDYERWLRERGLERDVRKQYLTVRVPHTNSKTAQSIKHALLRHQLLEPRKPAMWARPRLALSVALLAASLVGAQCARTTWGPQLQCWTLPGASTKLRYIDGQCVGHRDRWHKSTLTLVPYIDVTMPLPDGAVFGELDTELQSVYRVIDLQNRQVEEAHWRSEGRRPIVTLYHLGVSSGREGGTETTDGTERAYVAEVQELQGMALAQSRTLDPGRQNTENAPLLRIIVANSGEEMRHAGLVAEMIREHARTDPSVVGVVGVVESRDTTADAVSQLAEARLLTMAPTLSANDFYRNSDLMFLFSPPNSTQAAMITRYAQAHQITSVHAYLTTGEHFDLEKDHYVKTLNESLGKAMAQAKIAYNATRWSSDLEPPDCRNAMVFFGGRWSEFDEFLLWLASHSECKPKLLVANDSVGRYMANEQKRHHAPPWPLVYVSKAAETSCEALEAIVRTTSGTRRQRIEAFLAAARRSTWRMCAGGPGQTEPGERVGLAYDATMLVLDAVESRAQRCKPSPGCATDPVRVHEQIVMENERQRKRLAEGQQPDWRVSGTGVFVPDGEVINQKISLVEAKSIQILHGVPAPVPREVYSCSVAVSDQHLDCRDSAAREENSADRKKFKRASKSNAASAQPKKSGLLVQND